MNESFWSMAELDAEALARALEDPALTPDEREGLLFLQGMKYLVDEGILEEIELEGAHGYIAIESI